MLVINMVFSDEYKILIKNVYQPYKATELTNKFPNK